MLVILDMHLVAGPLVNIGKSYSEERDGRSGFLSCEMKMGFTPCVYFPELCQFISLMVATVELSDLATQDHDDTVKDYIFNISVMLSYIVPAIGMLID